MLLVVVLFTVAAVPMNFFEADRSVGAVLRNSQIVWVNEMQKDTVYKGLNIRLSATPSAGGTWAGSAQFVDDPGRVVRTDESFRSESEALSAALSRAMAEVDRDRMSRGKP
jgi:hypothetical protein